MNAILYSGTGINTVNIADSPTLLRNWGTVVKTTVLDCIQSYFLRSVTVKLTWEQAKNVDCVEIDGFFYFVDGVTMSSSDVAVFSLIPDFITSAGGPSALDYLDGITERHHVPKNSDVFGAYDEADPLISPAKVLGLQIGGEYFDSRGDYDNIDVVESSVDLVQLGDINYNYNGRTFEDPSNQFTVTVPSVPYVTNYTTFRMFGITTRTNGTQLFDVGNANVKRGLQVCRDLGIENGVISQYSIPETMFTVVASNGVVTDVNSKGGTRAWDDAPFIYASGYRNNRLFYGETSKYGIITASGNVAEFNPEEIYQQGKTAPSLVCEADGRHDGKPYFTFDYYHGTKVAGEPANFFTNAVDGMEWRNLPLRYITKSGSVQDSYRLESQRRSEVSANNYRRDAYMLGQVGTFVGAGGGFASSQFDITTASGAFASKASIGGYRSALAQSNIGGAINVLGTAVNATQNEYAYRQYEDQYKIAAEREVREFGFSQSILSPTIMFPFQTPSIRDYYGNGATPYRYYMGLSDLTRIDKLLTAYGYRHTAQIDPSFFTNRPDFNYIKANGVTVGGASIPRWWKEGITAQFASGVRVWHKKPNSMYYTMNE